MGIRRKERSSFSLDLFWSFWYNFEEQMIELLKCFVQFCQRDIKDDTVFHCRKITFC